MNYYYNNKMNSSYIKDVKINYEGENTQLPPLGHTASSRADEDNLKDFSSSGVDYNATAEIYRGLSQHKKNNRKNAYYSTFPSWLCRKDRYSEAKARGNEKVLKQLIF